MDWSKFTEAMEAQEWSRRRLHQLIVAFAIAMVFGVTGVIALWVGAFGMGVACIGGELFFVAIQALVGFDQDAYSSRATRLYGEIIGGR